MSTVVAPRLQGIAQPYPSHAKLRGEISPNVQPAWLSDAVRATVHATRGMAKVIADALGRRENHVTDLGDPTRRVALKAFEIPAITRASGSFAILDALEAQVGRVAFRLLASDGQPDGLHRELSAAVKQFGEVIEATGDALEDNTITPQELPAVVKEIDEAIAQLCTLRARVVAKAESDARKVHL